MAPETITPSITKPERKWKRSKTCDGVATETSEEANSGNPNDGVSSDGGLSLDRKRTATLCRRKTFHGQISTESRNIATPPGRFRRPRRSISDESSLSSTTSLMMPAGNQNLYHEAVAKLSHDDRWLKEITLGTRIGFYRLYRDVGKGNFSKVKMAVHYLTKEKVAVKIIDKAKLQAKNKQMLSKEVSAMESIRHPHIIRLFEVMETPSKLFLAMEFAEGGELFHRIATGGRIPEQDAKTIFAQLTSAVAHMHKHNIVHRDLKAENVFITGKNVKIGDFGFSTHIQNPKEVLLTFCGSPPYVAPEIFQNENYVGPSVDLWSLGVLLYFIVTASLPFKGDNVSMVKRKILIGEFPLPKYVSKCCSDLICGLLQLDPAKRLSTNQIKSSAWLKDASYPAAKNGKNSSCEKEVMGALDKMGITAEMLEKSLCKGVRSNLVGTYRILLHKYEGKLNAEEKTKKPKKIVISCPTFKSKTCSIV
ncbi:serine/threonine-protein kinase NIM1-like [Uloborus diversus]|uniref:serine/threonine-protein kinase NIM1-like n=1 Tax=Uloborus diversus TaxID=327109 RepID=UPI0024096181|nr:serine/threonine-protein kinase NIM1-like [Uloborus diversus]